MRAGDFSRRMKRNVRVFGAQPTSSIAGTLPIPAGARILDKCLRISVCCSSYCLPDVSFSFRAWVWCATKVSSTHHMLPSCCIRTSASSAAAVERVSRHVRQKPLDSPVRSRLHSLNTSRNAGRCRSSRLVVKKQPTMSDPRG